MSDNIFFLGNALLDISIECDSSLLEKYNLKSDENSELISGKEDLYEFLLENPLSLMSPGGSAQNSARIAQWIFDCKGKGLVIFAGCIGDDVYGKKLEEFMKSSKVQALYHTIEGESTGITAALVTNDGKRSLCARLGAAALFDRKYITSDPIQFAINSANIIYVEGYFVSHNPLCAVDIAKLSETLSKQFVVNLSATYICEKHFESLNACIAFADIVIGNRQEAEAFVSMHGHSTDDVVSCAKIISALNKKSGTSLIVIITQGPGPVVVIHGKTVLLPYDVPPVPKLGDTIGCGDAFVGGFLASLALKESLDASIKCGIRCAGLVAEQRGCLLPTSHI